VVLLVIGEHLLGRHRWFRSIVLELRTVVGSTLVIVAVVLHALCTWQ
jgi:hypothetical protein